MTEIQVAMGLFTLSYSVVLWYFTPKDPPPPAKGGQKNGPGTTLPLFRGLCYACGYHLGSLAFGSIVLGVLRPLTLLFGGITRASDSERGGKANSVVRPCLGCMNMIAKCFRSTIGFVNKNAYIDIAITSSNFCPACTDVVATLFTSSGKFVVLNGAAEVIAGVGSASMAFLGLLSAFLLVKLSCFSDESSEWYLEAPYAVVAIAGLVAFLAGKLFMIVFDQVADTLLYCYVTSVIDNNAILYAPNSLVQTFNDDHASCC